MAFSVSGYVLLTFKSIIQNDTAVDWPADAFKGALFKDASTPNFDTDTAYLQGAGAWATANEVTGTNYVAGGATLASLTLVITAGALVWDAADLAYPANMSVTNSRGVLIFDNTIATPVDKPAYMAITFGADVPVTNGVLTIQWPGAGIASNDLTP